jgi:hypothetical protein
MQAVVSFKPTSALLSKARHTAEHVAGLEHLLHLKLYHYVEGRRGV